MIFSECVKHQNSGLMNVESTFNGSHKFCLMDVLTLLFVSLLMLSGSVFAESRYIHKGVDEDTVIVFVHGILGAADDTWKSTNHYWPDLVAQDESFGGSSVFVIDYPTSVWANYSIDELADTMRLNLRGHGVDKHRRIVFLAHSMGGLVTRAFILKNREIAAKTVFTYFYSTPTTGSQIARIGSIAVNNIQLQQMKPMNAKSFLADQLRQWNSSEINIPAYCAYEKKKTFGILIVTLQSASALCNKPLDPLDYNHVDIVKPVSTNDQQYLAFKVAFSDEIGQLKPEYSHVQGLEVVLLKLSETQLIKSEYLFPQMEVYIADPSEKNWAIVKTTAKELLSEINVAVKKAIKVDASFVDRGEHIVQLTNSSINVVNRNYARPFEVSRKEWNGRAFELKVIIDQINAPTPSEVRELSISMNDRFERLQEELNELIGLVRESVQL